MRLLVQLVHRTVVKHVEQQLLRANYHSSRKFASSHWGSKKQHRKVPLYTFRVDRMADPSIEKQLEPLRFAVKEQVSWKGEKIPKTMKSEVMLLLSTCRAIW